MTCPTCGAIQWGNANCATCRSHWPDEPDCHEGNIGANIAGGRYPSSVRVYCERLAAGDCDDTDKCRANGCRWIDQEARSAATALPRYPTELVDCDRCDGMGEVEDDLWVWTRCYSCWGSGQVEVCAQCLDSGEECDACGC